jgi:serine phosphatase RsbU (regulator of sigma subunit)
MELRHDSLAFRLGLAVNLTALVVLVVFAAGDYRRERRAHLQEQAERLREEGKVLRVARQQLPEPAGFQQYVDDYCRQMERHVSPGHHIVVTDSTGQIISRAHVHVVQGFEAEMIVLQGDGRRRFEYENEEFMVVGVDAGNGATILVAQSLAPMKRVIRRQATSRAVSVTVLVAMVIVVTNLMLWRLVRRPIRRLTQGVEAVRERRFDHRIEQLNTAELQFLGDGFNRMSAELEKVELIRQLEMDKARRIHLGLLPPESATIPGLSMAARYSPADSVGGDYYDMLEYQDGRWLILIADVSGHGVSAALVTAMIKALSRQAVAQGQPPLDIAKLLNRELELLTGSEHFVTFLAWLYDPKMSELQYVNCGHEPGVILASDGKIKHRLQTGGLPLGIVSDATWNVGTCTLERGEQLYLMTDGLIEVYNDLGEMLGRDRLVQLLSNRNNGSPGKTVDKIIGEIGRFQGKDSFADDATLVTLWRDG